MAKVEEFAYQRESVDPSPELSSRERAGRLRDFVVNTTIPRLREKKALLEAAPTREALKSNFQALIDMNTSGVYVYDGLRLYEEPRNPQGELPYKEKITIHGRTFYIWIEYTWLQHGDDISITAWIAPYEPKKK
jgi:hypothetical protein